MARHHFSHVQLSNMPGFACRDIISNKSKAAAGLCDWAINIVKYYDVVSEVEPKRLELAGANEKLAAANTTLKQVQDKVALLNAQVQELEDQYNKVGASYSTSARQAADVSREVVFELLSYGHKERKAMHLPSACSWLLLPKII